MPHCITVLPQILKIEAAAGDNLLCVLRSAGFAPDAPCGGNGSCGKCRVLIDGEELLACQTVIDRNMCVTLSPTEEACILEDGITPRSVASPDKDGYLLAFDIGTTTVVGYLLDGQNGQELACESVGNPQTAFGADVISRIHHALNGQLDMLTTGIRTCVTQLSCTLCNQAGIRPDDIRTVSIVGNPAMQ